MPQTNSSKRSATRAIRWISACQGGLRRRPVRQERGVVSTDPRLDAFEQEPEEQILPGLCLAQTRTGGGSQCGRIICGCEHVGANVTRESLRQGEALDLRHIGRDTAAGHDRRQHGPQIGDGLVDQRSHIGARPIPFQHGELRRVQIAALTVPPHARKLEDRASPGHQQFLHGELGTGVQPERLAGAVRRFTYGAERTQVHFLPGSANGVRCLHFGIATRDEECAGGDCQQRAAAQEWQARGEALGMPDGLRHVFNVTSEWRLPPHRHDCATT